MTRILNFKSFGTPSIARKMVVSFLLISFVPAIIVGFITYKISETGHKHEVLESLIAIALNKEALFTEYIREKERDVRALSYTPVIRDMMVKCHIAFHNGGLGSPEYISLDEKHRPFFNEFTREFAYYDFLLVDTEGNVVYSVKKEADLGTNLVSGPYRFSEAARTFNLVMETGETRISDFKYYEPSDVPAIFIGAPVKKADRTTGVVIIQLQYQNIYREAQNYTGLGRTGEIVLAAREEDEAVFLIPLRHDPGSAFNRSVRLGSDQALPIQHAVRGEAGAGTSIDYRGKKILAAWKYLPATRWGMVVKMDIDEAYQHIYMIRRWAISIVSLAIIAVTFVAFRVSRTISTPIRTLHRGIEKIGSGNLDHKVATSSNDEIGELSRAFDDMTMNLKLARRKVELEIEERRQIESDLRKEKDTLQKYLDISAVMVIIIDRDQKVSLINKKGCEILGYNENEIIGKNWFDNFLPEWMREDVRLVFTQLLAGEISPVEYHENPVLNRSGEERIIAWYNTVFRDENNNILATLSSGVDITEIKKAEEALRESETRYRLLFNQAPDAIVLLDADTGDMLELNEAAHTKLGFTRDESSKLAISDIEAVKSEEGIKHHLKKIKENGYDLFETVTRTKDGELRNVLINARLISVRGRNVIQAISTDITEQKKAEEKLKDLNAEMEQIIQVTSHDLRTPLAIVSSYGREMERFIEDISPLMEKECLSPDLKEKLSNVQKDIGNTLNYIKSNIKKMDSLLNGLLKLSRSGRVELHIENIDMNRLMDEIAGTHELQVKRKGVKLEISELPACNGDELQITQVFSNLIGNALKYLDPARPGIITISGRVADGRSVYCVEDNGIGIPPEHHRKIFEIFHQVDRTSGKGEGLGLTMVRKILDRHDGKIWLESEPGKGSRFFVSLPA